MKTANEILDVDLNHWVAGTRFFATSDGRYFVIDADVTEYPEGINTFIRRNTAVLYCNADASVTDMTPDFVYDPGTTPEQAIALMGYELTGN